MIIVNQEKNLFKPIVNFRSLEIYQEEKEIEIYKKENCTFAKPVYGDWLFRMNNKIYARYKTTDEKDCVVDQLIKAFEYNKNLFVFPLYEKNHTVVLNHVNSI